MATTTRTDEILAGIQEQLGVMNNQLENVATDMRLVKSAVNGLDARMGSLETRMGTVENRMETMNGHLQGLRQDMADMTILVRERIPATGP